MAKSVMIRPDGRPKHCAIYTRKSTEEGLDQAFNSLDAQREACEAYIISQRHEGWQLVPEPYDDGGFSGGTMERPALKRLLAAVRAGAVDIIIVYKVDRLTRSLADFAKIVDVLDAAGASFVSITQAFNTTTSMGRLTLNVLLSFAQFEREVISERVRDKIAASKAKGMWMGGPVPLGYRVEDRKLVVDDTEAATVRQVMQLYLDHASVPALVEDLKSRGIVTKRQSMRDGSKRGGIAFTRGPLYHLLKNRIYVGEITHKDKTYPGEHKAIINADLFEAVQMRLADNVRDQQRGTRSSHPSLLTGMIRDHRGRPMSPRHAVKDGKRYRYYVSNDEVAANFARNIVRLAAGDLERAVIDALHIALDDSGAIMAHLAALGISDTQHVIVHAKSIGHLIIDLSSAGRRDLLEALDLAITIHNDAIMGSISVARLMARANVKPQQVTARIDFSVPLARTSDGHEVRMRVDPPSSAVVHDEKLVALLITAHAAYRQLLDLDPADYDAHDPAVRHRQRIGRLAFLAPDIVESILEGRQPRALTTRALSRIVQLSLDWNEQRRQLGFG